MVDPWRRSPWDVLKVVVFVLLGWLFSWPKCYCWISPWTRHLILFRGFSMALRRLLREIRVATVLLKLIFVESIVFEWTGFICGDLSGDYFLRLDRKMRCPLFIWLSLGRVCPHIVGSWTWGLIAFILASVRKADFLLDVLKLISLFWPFHRYAIVVCSWKVQLFFSFFHFIEVCFLLCSFALKPSLFEPLLQLIRPI